MLLAVRKPVIALVLSINIILVVVSDVNNKEFIHLYFYLFPGGDNIGAASTVASQKRDPSR